MSGASSIVVAADVGGTHSKLALGFSEAGSGIVVRKVYASDEHAAFETVLQRFLDEPEVKVHAADVRAACIAVAGPVEHGRSRLTNLPWCVDEGDLARDFSIPRVSVINDFAAAGLGIAELQAADLLTLQAGVVVPHAARVIIGAGTGLGVAWLTWNEGCYRVHPSEGGHADFAPIDDTQDRLLQHLRRELGHVSVERVLSGNGLTRIFAFLRQEPGAAAPTQDLLDAMASGDDAGAISKLALEKRDALAERALDVFASIYGAFAGNMALTALAHGGVYIAGGIAPKIAAKMQDGAFMRAFTAKGRLRSVLETLAVHVVMNPHVGLLGAAAEAARLARDPP
ncbi:MAG: glucokinase [Pseudomonadota bacterium]